MATTNKTSGWIGIGLIGALCVAGGCGNNTKSPTNNQNSSAPGHTTTNANPAPAPSNTQQNAPRSVTACSDLTVAEFTAGLFAQVCKIEAGKCVANNMQGGYCRLSTTLRKLRENRFAPLYSRVTNRFGTGGW